MRTRSVRQVCASLLLVLSGVTGCGGRELPAVGPSRTDAVAAAAAADPASVSESARRATGPRPASACEQIAFVVGTRTAAPQIVVVRAPTSTSTTATLQVATLTERGWVCGTAHAARVGRNGVRPLLDRRSGDGTTPAGVFPLGRMTAWDGQRFSVFGNAPDPGVTAGPYRAVRTGDCFGATPNDANYGHLVQRAAAECPGPDDEYLPRYAGVYAHAALIGANMEPNVSGDAPGETPYAAAIFLHRHSYDSSGATRSTSGCVSLALAELVAVLREMRPGVVFAIGTDAWLAAGSW